MTALLAQVCWLLVWVTATLGVALQNHRARQDALPTYVTPSVRPSDRPTVRPSDRMKTFKRAHFCSFQRPNQSNNQ